MTEKEKEELLAGLGDAFLERIRSGERVSV
jgi:hypothetical protein